MKKLILFLAVMLCLGNLAYATTLYPVNALWNPPNYNLWSSNRTWNTASNQALGNHAAPKAGDVVILDVGMRYAPIWIDQRNNTCNSLTVTSSFVNLTWLNRSSVLSPTGAVILYKNMNMTPFNASSIFNLSYMAGATLATTFNGVRWGGELVLTGVTVAITLTLSNVTKVNGLRTKTTTGVITLNSNRVNIERWLKTNGIIDGTTLLNMTGGKYYKSDSATHIIGNSVTFCGDVTWDSTIRWGRTAGRIFKWASGTITMPTPSYLNFSGSGTINWPATAPQLQRIGASAASTIVMSQNLALGVSLENVGSLTWNGAYNLTIPNCYACNSLAGTATLKFQGSNCNWSRSATSVHAMGVIMNCSTLTIDNGVSWGAAGQTLRYVAGNVIPKEKGSFNIFPQTPKLNTGPVVFYNLNIGSTSSPSTISLLSNLNVSGILSVARDRTINFTGPFNVEVGNLSIPNPSSTIAYGFAIAAGRTLKINTAISAGGYSNTFPNVFKFSSGTTNSKAYINYRGTMQNMELAGTGFKDIESTNGRLATWFGTLTATTNIDSLNPFNFYNLYGVI